MSNLVSLFMSEVLEKNQTFKNYLLISTVHCHIFFALCSPMYLFL